MYFQSSPPPPDPRRLEEAPSGKSDLDESLCNHTELNGRLCVSNLQCLSPHYNISDRLQRRYIYRICALCHLFPSSPRSGKFWGGGNVCWNSLSQSSVKVSAASSSVRAGKSSSHSWCHYRTHSGRLNRLYHIKGSEAPVSHWARLKWSECLRSRTSLNFSSPTRDPNKTLAEAGRHVSCHQRACKIALRPLCSRNNGLISLP